MEHSELVAEMAQVEHLSTQDRLHLARMRRTHQLKVAKQKEKEWLKSQSRRDRNANLAAKKQRHITFENSVVVLEAAARNDIEEVGRLLELGVSPDATNEDGLTPLHQCCIDNNADMLRLLLDYGAAVNAKDSEKWTPLHAAATCGHLYLVKILISRGANLLAVNVDGNMPYDLCDDEETLDCIEAEMSRRGVTQELIDETRAATENQMLLDLTDVAARGGDLESPDKHGATPLHIAAANGYSKVVEFLLEHQACVDSVDKDLWTPVHAAACWGHMEVLEMLAMSGADLNACNKNEETPSDICEDAEIRERIEQLKTEQESKRQAEAQRRRVRRSQSNNTRAQSVRRTSLRDKTLTTKKDAVEETRLRLQAQEGFTVPDSTTEPNSIASDVTDSTAAASSSSSSATTSVARPLTAGNASSSSGSNNSAIVPVLPNGHHHPNGPTASTLSNGSHNITVRYPVGVAVEPRHSLTGGGGGNKHHTVAYAPQQFDAALSRRSPDGTDNDAYLLAEELKGAPHNNNNNNNGVHHQQLQQQHHNNNSGGSGGVVGGGGGKLGNNENISAEIFSTSNDNGKINVQVTVLVDTHQLDQSLAGTTLANLKKQRAQSRTSTSSTDNGSYTGSAATSTTMPTTTTMTAIGPTTAVSAAAASASAAAAATGSHHLHHRQGSSNSHNSSAGNHHSSNGILTMGNHHEPSGKMQQQQQLELRPATVSALSDATAPKITKFSGVTSDVVSDSTSRRCCVVM